MGNRKKQGVTGAGIRLATRVRFARGGKQDDMAVLVCPDGRVQLNRIAATILRLCDGTRTREEIVAEVVRLTEGPTRIVEIVEFLDAARARGWIDGA